MGRRPPGRGVVRRDNGTADGPADDEPAPGDREQDDGQPDEDPGEDGPDQASQARQQPEGQ